MCPPGALRPVIFPKFCVHQLSQVILLPSNTVDPWNNAGLNYRGPLYMRFLHLTADQLAHSLADPHSSNLYSRGNPTVGSQCMQRADWSYTDFQLRGRLAPQPLHWSRVNPNCASPFCPHCDMEIGKFRISFPLCFINWLCNKGDRKGGGCPSSLQEGLNQQEQR